MQKIRGTARGAPSEPNATSSLGEIVPAITSLRAGQGDMRRPITWMDRLELRSQDPVTCPFLRAVDDDRVLRMNPRTTNPASIRAGDQVRMPKPQRPSR